MKPNTLPVKRTPVSKGIFRRLSAVTRSRRQRVAATASAADFEDGDHSSKISRALTIIFLIHVVVIGLILFHMHYLDSDRSKTAASVKKVEAALPPAREMTLPKISSGDAIYRAAVGDNYARIAAKQEVEENDLRAANNNMDIVPGRIMKIPPKHLVAVDPPEVEAIRENAPSDHDRGLVEAVPVTGAAPRAQLVRPTIAAPENAVQRPAATPVVQKPAPLSQKPANTAAAAPSGKTYVVQSGDNFYRIAGRFKVDHAALMKVNGISDPKKLKPGMTLKIPN